MSGPAPEPTRLKALRGNPGKHRLNDREPAPEPFDGTAPDDLTPGARALWDELVPRLVRLGTVTEIDPGEFAVGCETRALGRTLLASEARGDREEALKLLRYSSSIFARYGVGASDRSRIVVTPPAPPKSKWSGLLGGKKRA